MDLTSDEDIENAYNKQSSSSASKEEPSKEEPPADVKAPASKTSQKSTSDSEVKGVRPISNEEEEFVDEENEALEELATFPKDIKEKIIEKGSGLVAKSKTKKQQPQKPIIDISRF